MHFDAEFWDTIAFIAFVGLLGYFGLHKKVADALDKRRRAGEGAARRSDLPAQGSRGFARLFCREEEAGGRGSQGHLSPRRKSKPNSSPRKPMPASPISSSRRTKQAEDKIASAETQALAQVRDAATDAAAKASEIVLKTQAQGAYGDELVEQGIAGLKRLLH